MKRTRVGIAVVGVVAALSTALAGCSLNSSPSAKEGSLANNADLKGAKLIVGSKEFTEQLVMCNLTTLSLKSAGADVTSKCGLSGSNTARTALTSGKIDMYWEYTGTAWVNYLKHTDPVKDPTEQYNKVAQEDLSKNQIKWLDAASANNTYAIAAKASKATELGVSSVSDYAKLANSDPSKASMCIASEFAGRSDGWPGLQKAYGFTLPKKNTATLAEGAIYNAIGKSDPCNFGETFATDGRIKALDLTVLKDDKQFFPVYNPALNVRESVYKKYPDIAKVINPIAKALDTKTLQNLNAQVDVDGKDPEKVAQKWLQDQGFIGK